jgi:peptidyl-prolyl cis-trans isomerase SurA
MGGMKFVRVLCLGVFGVSLLPGADPTLVEEIIAKVNGDIITRGDLERARRDLAARLQQQGVTGARLQEQLQSGSANILRDKIDQLLLVQKAKEMNLNVDGEVSKYLARLQAESKIADPEKFHEYVHQQVGMPYEDYRNEIKNSMLTERVIREEVARRIQIKPEELHKYYDEHKKDFLRDERVFLSEILISTDGKDAAGIAAAEKKAKDIATRAANGEKFADLARDNSDNPASARNGGDIGAFQKGSLRSDIEAAVWDKPRGFVTQPIKVDNGFLILKVEDHQKAGQATFEEVQNEIMDKLFMPRMEPAMREYLTKLRQDAFLEIKEGYVDSGAAPGKDTSWSDPAQLKPETVTKEEVSAQTRRRRLLWLIPIPGTRTSDNSNSSSRN